MSTDIRSTLSDLVEKRNNGKTVKNPRGEGGIRVEKNRGRATPKKKLMDVIGEGMRAYGVNGNDRVRDRVKGERYGQSQPPLHFI